METITLNRKEPQRIMVLNGMEKRELKAFYRWGGAPSTQAGESAARAPYSRVLMG